MIQSRQLRKLRSSNKSWVRSYMEIFPLICLMDCSSYGINTWCSFLLELLHYIGKCIIYLEIWLVALNALYRFFSWFCPVYSMVSYLLSPCIIDSEFPGKSNYLDSTISSKWLLRVKYSIIGFPKAIDLIAKLMSACNRICC